MSNAAHRMETQSIFVLSMYAPGQSSGFFWGPVLPDTDLGDLFDKEVELWAGDAHVRMLVLDVPTGPALGFPDSLCEEYRAEISDRLDSTTLVADWDEETTIGAVYAVSSIGGHEYVMEELASA